MHLHMKVGKHRGQQHSACVGSQGRWSPAPQGDDPEMDPAGEKSIHFLKWTMLTCTVCGTKRYGTLASGQQGAAITTREAPAATLRPERSSDQQLSQQL